MARKRDRDEFETEGRGSWMRNGTVLVVGLAIGAVIWWQVNDQAGVRREAPRMMTVSLTPPPPPPPPPPPKERPPEQKPIERPKPVETPQPDAPKPLTIAGDAQAGTDAFNIGAGDGSGSLGNGTGFGEATYTRYMQSALQDAIERDDRVSQLVFTAELLVWIDEHGRLSRARVLRSAGNPVIDQALVAASEGLVLEQSPPSTLRFPQRVRMSGRKTG
jgi:TonB family protein